MQFSFFRTMPVITLLVLSSFGLFAGPAQSPFQRVCPYTSNPLGGIDGVLERSAFPDAQIVVYAYLEGEYSKAEIVGEGKERFMNAEAAAMVQSDGSFSLTDLAPGKYQLVFAAFSPKSDDWDFKGTFLLAGDAENLVNVKKDETAKIAYRAVELLPTDVGN